MYPVEQINEHMINFWDLGNLLLSDYFAKFIPIFSELPATYYEVNKNSGLSEQFFNKAL